MTDLIATIQPDIENKDNEDQKEPLDEFEDIETTDMLDIENFNKLARAEASKELSTFKELTTLSDPMTLRTNISCLNQQQRRIFDDITERMASTDLDENPVFLFLAGNAGTGKSFLVNLLIEAVKLIKIKAGDELKKPPVIVMAPTANAA